MFIIRENGRVPHAALLIIEGKDARFAIVTNQALPSGLAMIGLTCINYRAV